MKDLRDAMLDAGAPRDDWNAEIPALIAAGQKRVRRRKIIATSVAAAAVAIVGTTAALAGLPGLNRADPDPVKPDKRGVYVEERLAPAEVDRRCSILLGDGQPAKGQWLAGRDADGKAVPAEDSVKPIETRVGYPVSLWWQPTKANDKDKPADDGDGNQLEVSTPPHAGLCVIPQGVDNLQPVRRLPDPEDSDAVVEGCSRSGYNFKGWSVLAAAQHGTDVLVAVLKSVNGYAVECDVWIHANRAVSFKGMRRIHDDNGAPILPPGHIDPSRNEHYKKLTAGCEEVDGSFACIASGLLGGLPDAYRIEVTLPSGEAVSTTTERGAFAVSFSLSRREMRELDKGQPVQGRPKLTWQVTDEDNEVVWEGVQ